jgi:hypothetical protein
VSEIKVTDKRMFTADGRLKEEFAEELARTAREPEPPPQPEPPPAPPATPPAAAASPFALPGAATEKAPTGLLELAQFLGELAVACLGDVAMPDGRLLLDLDGARFYIDLIGALLERFGKALAPQDRRALESFLDQLRLRYVARRG